MSVCCNPPEPMQKEKKQYCPKCHVNVKDHNKVMCRYPVVTEPDSDVLKEMSDIANRDINNSHTPFQQTNAEPLIAPLQKMSRDEFKKYYPPVEDDSPLPDISYLYKLLCEINHRLERVELRSADLLVQTRELKWGHEIKEDSPDETKRNVTKDAQESSHEHLMTLINECKTNINKFIEFMGSRSVDYELQFNKIRSWNEFFHENYNERIKKLEDQVKEINGQKFSEFHSLTPRVNALEEKISEKYAHPNVIGRLERLEGYMSMEDRVTASDVLIRLSQLEDRCGHNNGIVCKDLNDLDAEVCEQKRTIEMLVGSLKGVETQLGLMDTPKLRVYSTKIPHKCPVCDGEGMACLKNNYLTAHLHTDECKVSNCKACESKGIVWG